jgi:hypothetical protein
VWQLLIGPCSVITAQLEDGFECAPDQDTVILNGEWFSRTKVIHPFFNPSYYSENDNTMQLNSIISDDFILEGTTAVKNFEVTNTEINYRPSLLAHYPYINGSN